MEGVSLAQAIAALGATGILALLFILWLTGKLHSDTETKNREEQFIKEIAFREQMRLEAVADRKAADEKTAQMRQTMQEQNELTKRALDLNERLLEEFVRPPNARTRRADRDRT